MMDISLSLVYHKKTKAQIMLLGSTEYDDSQDDDDLDVVITPSPYTSKWADRVKREARQLNKIDGMEKRERNATRYENKEIRNKKHAKLLDDMNKMVPDRTEMKTPPTSKNSNCTFASSGNMNVSKVPSSIVTTTTSTVCGYQVNPVSEIKTEKVEVFTQHATEKHCRGCNLYKSECPNLKYGKYCQQRVIDYYHKVGWTFTDEGIKTAHNEAYFAAVQRDKCMATGVYELSSEENSIPKCVQLGSIQSSVEMLRGHRSFVQLSNERVFKGQVVHKQKKMSMKESIEDLESD